MSAKSKTDYLEDATAEELTEELKERRRRALGGCSDEELEAELRKRPGVDRPPRIVEK